jgi:serine/threonine protein kinase/Tfp pilus assembly protein PilF
VVARFESERQALALMDHPGIAKVFEAGATPQGRPYFAMEYVTGMPITDYCDKHKLTTRQRLELLMLVCDAVQHAHQKAILHRDLKPSNILVGEVDGKPAPRIIDFGVAKATVQRLTAGTLYTRVGAMVGTPGYMSPEQADSAGTDVDTRTDVYSLGVVLYELLVGVLPLDFSRTAADQFPRRLRDEDAPRPSTRLRTLGEQGGATAQSRGVDGATLARQIRGDLDAIALKALEKDRARRYATPSEFAADIGRYLRHEPVLAHQASAAYRARKYVRRHRLGVAFAATAAALLVSVAVVQAVELRRIKRERDRADRVTEFMTGMFKVSDPSEARGNDIRAREILDKASKDIDTGLAKDPELQAQMMHMMGNVYESLGLYAQSESLLRRAVGIRRRTLGAGNSDTLQSMNDLAFVLDEDSHYAEAEKVAREALDTRRHELGLAHRDTLDATHTLAAVLWSEGRYPEAEKLNREALAAARRALTPQDQLIGKIITNLALDLLSEGRYAEAEKLFREVLEIDLRAFGPDHPVVLGDLMNLASSLSGQLRETEAEKLYSETLDADRRVLGREHPDTLLTMANLGGILSEEKRYAEAEKLYREALPIMRKRLGPDHAFTLLNASNLAQVLTAEGRCREAEELLRQTLATERRILGPEHNYTLHALDGLGEVLTKEKRYPEAEKAYRETLAGMRRALGDGHPDTASVAYGLAAVLALEGKRDESFANLPFAVEHALDADLRGGLEKDPNLKSLHGDARFDALVESSRQRLAAVPKSN